MTTLLDKKQSVIGKVQDPDEATLDQVLSRIAALAPMVARHAGDFEQVGDCRRSSCPLSSRHGFTACSDPGWAGHGRRCRSLRLMTEGDANPSIGHAKARAHTETFAKACGCYRRDIVDRDHNRWGLHDAPQRAQGSCHRSGNRRLVPGTRAKAGRRRSRGL